MVALDVGRSWFRYDRLLADLLQMELRRSAPVEVIGLHRHAADWLARHERQVQAVQHAQPARDWVAAARLLADHCLARQLAEAPGPALIEGIQEHRFFELPPTWTRTLTKATLLAYTVR